MLTFQVVVVAIENVHRVYFLLSEGLVVDHFLSFSLQLHFGGFSDEIHHCPLEAESLLEVLKILVVFFKMGMF